MNHLSKHANIWNKKSMSVGFESISLKPRLATGNNHSFHLKKEGLFHPTFFLLLLFLALIKLTEFRLEKR